MNHIDTYKLECCSSDVYVSRLDVDKGFFRERMISRSLVIKATVIKFNWMLGGEVFEAIVIRLESCAAASMGTLV